MKFLLDGSIGHSHGRCWRAGLGSETLIGKATGVGAGRLRPLHHTPRPSLIRGKGRGGPTRPPAPAPDMPARPASRRSPRPRHGRHWPKIFSGSQEARTTTGRPGHSSRRPANTFRNSRQPGWFTAAGSTLRRCSPTAGSLVFVTTRNRVAIFFPGLISEAKFEYRSNCFQSLGAVHKPFQGRAIC
jgi:hypothetical protein